MKKDDMQRRVNASFPTGQGHARSQEPKVHGVRRRYHRTGTIAKLKPVLVPILMFCLGMSFTLYFITTSKSNTYEETSDRWNGRSLRRGISSPFEKHKARMDEMEGIGDKSKFYRSLREEYDAKFPLESSEERRQTLVQFAESLKKRQYRPRTQDIPYDVFNCPFDPPEKYPFAWNILDILRDWPPDDPTPRLDVYQGLCVFDYDTELKKALHYRSKEVPFVIRNDPSVLRTVERWNQPEYLHKLLKEHPHRAEYSPNNHFMYWMLGKGNKKKQKANKPGKIVPKDWKPPTKMIRMSYPEWISKANITDPAKVTPDTPHWYFRLIGCGALGDCDRGSSEFLFDELPFFQPKKSLYIVEPDQQKGIHCRFGMRGVIAENHFDGSRNMIALLGGERRYVLAHPEQCEHLALLPKEHPSGRHSAVDWSEPDLEEYPEFQLAMANEVVMQPGDVLYLPTNWFHYIISLEMNFQCNTRSGISLDYMRPIRTCGF